MADNVEQLLRGAFDREVQNLQPDAALAQRVQETILNEQLAQLRRGRGSRLQGALAIAWGCGLVLTLLAVGRLAFVSLSGPLAALSWEPLTLNAQSTLVLCLLALAAWMLSWLWQET